MILWRVLKIQHAQCEDAENRQVLRVKQGRLGSSEGWVFICFRLGHYNARMLIEGVFAAVSTPFYSDEKVYLRKLEANMDRYSRGSLAGMLVLGSTGEAALLDEAESREVLRVAAEATAPEKVLIAGVSHESVKGTVEVAQAVSRRIKCSRRLGDCRSRDCHQDGRGNCTDAGRLQCGSADLECRGARGSAGAYDGGVE